MKQAVHACERKELFPNYDEAVNKGADSFRKYKKADDDHKSAKERKAPTTEINSLKEAGDGHYKAVEEHEQERVNAAEGFFSLYANLLSVGQDREPSNRGNPLDGLEGEHPNEGTCENEKVIQ